jgi:hypothetical protein
VTKNYRRKDITPEPDWTVPYSHLHVGVSKEAKEERSKGRQQNLRLAAEREGNKI